MARKRKRDTKSAETELLKQQQAERQPEEEDEEVEEDPEEDPEEENEEEEEDVDGENEEEDGDEEEEEEEEGDDNEAEGEDEDEPFEELLKPFDKEKLINLLSEAARKHTDVADLVHNLANEDPAHRKIFVHGLSWDATGEQLVNAFKEYGEIEDSRLIVNKTTGASKGYGFVLFKTRSGARKALVEPQKVIGNRKTSCQLASAGPVPAPIVTPAQPVSEYTQRKIYVSNVAAELDPQKLLKFFSQYGDIEDGPLGLDKNTGKPKGFCLFVYKTVASAKKALEVPHKNFEGHTLHCREAIDGLKQSKLSLNSQHPPQAHKNKLQKTTNTGLHGPGQFMPPAATGSPFNQGAPAQAFNQAIGQGLNPAVGQALTTLLGLNNLLGTLGAAGVGAGVNPPVAPGASHGLQSLYGNQAASMGSGQAGYSNQQMGSNGTSSSQAGYSYQQSGQGGPGWSQHGYMGGTAPPY